MILDLQKKDELIKSALDAQKNSYSPYSNYKVGAALLTEEGKIFTGCNIENSSYPCGICAERVALSKAVSEGHKKFLALAVIGSSKEICTPCGMCRQMLFEFAPNLEIFCCSVDKKSEVHTLSNLLEKGFGPESL